MLTLVRTPVTHVWLLLIVATGASFWVAVDHGVEDQRIATALVLTVAVLKAYLIGMFFMELRHAPFALRAAFNGWCVICWLATLGVYLVG